MKLKCNLLHCPGVLTARSSMIEVFVALGAASMDDVSFNECTLLFYRVLLGFGPSPLWSPTGCTISEPDPNSAAACGVSGAPTLAAGLKRRVSSKRPPLSFFHFLNESTSDSVDRQVSTHRISVAFYL